MRRSLGLSVPYNSALNTIMKGGDALCVFEPNAVWFDSLATFLAFAI